MRLHRHSLFPKVLGFFLVCSLAAAAEEPVSLPALLMKAREQNPELEAARQMSRVKIEEAKAAGVWDPIKFSYADEKFPSGTPSAPTEKIHHYRVEQTIPFPGKLSLDVRMKHHEALIAEASYRSKERDVLSEVRMRYYQLYLTDQEISLAQQSVEVLKNALASAQGRLGANVSSTSDVFMAQTELGMLKNKLFEAQQQRKLVAIDLNTLLNQDPSAPFSSAAAPALQDLPLTLAQIGSLTREQSPLYQSATHELNHSRAMLAHNRLEWAPDFGVLYEREQTPSGPDGRMIGVSLSVPVWFQRPLANVRAGRAHVQEAAATADAMQRMALKSVAMEFVETNTHLQLARNYLNEIIPSAQSNLKIAQQQYAGGQTDFLHLLEAFRAWIDAHAGYETQLYHSGEHWSELERWVGVDLTEAAANRTSPLENSHAH
jgi:outer membrane protein, heavy metal efflux system